MAKLIDTNITIHMRDADPVIINRMAVLPEQPKLSLLSRVELEGGVLARPELAVQRRAFLDSLLRNFQWIDFDNACADGYRTIVEQCGFSRSRTLDRMIAATALVHDLTLITTNGDDFRQIPHLKLEIW